MNPIVRGAGEEKNGAPMDLTADSDEEDGKYVKMRMGDDLANEAAPAEGETHMLPFNEVLHLRTLKIIHFSHILGPALVENAADRYLLGILGGDLEEDEDEDLRLALALSLAHGAAGGETDKLPIN